MKSYRYLQGKKAKPQNTLCAYLFDRFNIKTHSDQDTQQLLSLVKKDRQRQEGRMLEADEMVRPALKYKITILERYPYGTDGIQSAAPDSRSTPLPSFPYFPRTSGSLRSLLFPALFKPHRH